MRRNQSASKQIVVAFKLLGLGSTRNAYECLRRAPGRNLLLSAGNRHRWRRSVQQWNSTILQRAMISEQGQMLVLAVRPWLPRFSPCRALPPSSTAIGKKNQFVRVWWFSFFFSNNIVCYNGFCSSQDRVVWPENMLPRVVFMPSDKIRRNQY